MKSGSTPSHTRAVALLLLTAGTSLAGATPDRTQVAPLLPSSRRTASSNLLIAAAQQHVAPLTSATLLPLRFRGGSSDSSDSSSPSSAERNNQQQQQQTRRRANSVAVAAQKLCTAPSLIAATGGDGGGSFIRRHVRGVVFGGLDGILTTFALLAAVAGSKQTSPSLMLVIGISTVLADALSMGAGEYLSAKAEEELSGDVADPDEPGPLEKGLAMFVAFTLFGSLPLVGGIASSSLKNGPSPFLMSVIITALSLFALGGIKSQFGAGVWWLAGLEVTGIGGMSATIAYFSASAVEKLMGDGSGGMA